MTRFSYTIHSEHGMHARPAGNLVRLTKDMPGEILLQKDERQCDARKLMALMSLGIRQGDTITVTVDGDREEQTAAELETFFRENL